MVDGSPYDQMNMKHTKFEVINATVESYLKRRHYQDIDMLNKSKRIKSCSSEEMMLSIKAECGTFKNNSIVFSAISNDVIAANQSYQKLKHCINGLENEKLKVELNSVLYPIFCHLYLEMLHAGNPQVAVQFMRNQQADFTLETEKDFLKELSTVYSVQAIELKSSVNIFRKRKYKVYLSDEAHMILQKFLAKHGHVILMQIINTHVTVVKELPNMQLVTNEDEEKCEKWGYWTINGYDEQPGDTNDDRMLREYQEALGSLQNTDHQPLRTFIVHNANETASCGIIAPSMSKLAAGFSTAEIRLWGIGDTVLTKPKLTCNFTAAFSSSTIENLENDNTDETGAVILTGHSDVVHDLRFISDPEVLLSVSSDNDMRAWRLEDYKCAAVYRGHNFPIWCMDTSAFNLYIATGSHDKTARLWMLDRTFPLRIYAGHFLDINCVRFHPNTQYLATASSDKTVRLWNKDDGNLLRIYAGAQSAVYTLTFSPDGKYLASAGDDKSIEIWDLAMHSKLTELKGHQESILNLAWSPNGNFITSSSLDNVVNFWSVQEYIKMGNTVSSDSMPTANTQTFATSCSSILSLRYYKKSNNSPVCVGAK